MRPQFHFTASSGWINDPHGITFRDGGYDVFYQYVPGSTEWAANCHWGHARGPDLLSLSEGPVALGPGDGDDGIWSGGLVRGGDGLDRIFYTAVTEPEIGVGRIRVATAADGSWDRWLKGPVVAEAPPGLDLLAFRDPFVLAEPDGSWRMFVGAALSDGHAAALAYRSTDLDTWIYEGIALQRSTREQQQAWTGALWECPQIVALADRHVMISSVWEADVLHYAAYAVGFYAAGHFAADSWGRLTFGPSYYAPSFFTDAEGRACVTFWMRGIKDAALGWAGAHSLPYVLGLEKERLIMTPHPDLSRYRGEPSATGEIAGRAADAIWVPGGSLVVRSADREAATLTVANFILSLRVGQDSWQMPYVGGQVRVIVDGPTLEVASSYGLIGAAIQPAGESLEFDADSSLDVWPLVR